MNEEETTTLREQLRDLARRLPALLGGGAVSGWTARTDRIEEFYPQLRLVRHDGMQISISAAGLDSDDLVICGDTPKEARHREPGQMGTVSVFAARTATPAQITAEIRRALLPFLDATAAEIAQQRERHAAAIAQVTDAVRALAAIPRVTAVPVSAQQRRDGRDARQSLYWNARTPWRSPKATVNVTACDGQPRIELRAEHLTPELARAVLAALNAAHTAEPGPDVAAP